MWVSLWCVWFVGVWCDCEHDVCVVVNWLVVIVVVCLFVVCVVVVNCVCCLC